MVVFADDVLSPLWLKTAGERLLLLRAFSFIAQGHEFKFNSNSVCDWNHWLGLKHKRRQHRAKLNGRHRISIFQNHLTTPVDHLNNDSLDPLASLSTFAPSKLVLHGG